MNRITVFLLQLIIVAIGYTNSATLATPPSQQRFIYQASVQNSSNSHICNGVILHRSWIVTLAQCVSNHNADELKVFYGSNQLNQNGLYVDVKQIYIHPAYDRKIIRSDIALLLTATDITFIQNISGSVHTIAGSINLPEHDVPINQQLTTSGWNVSVSKYEIFNIDVVCFHTNLSISGSKQFRLAAVSWFENNFNVGMSEIESIAKPHYTHMVDLLDWFN